MSNKSASNNAGVSEEVRLADVKKEGVANYLTQLKELPQESEEKKDEKKGAFAMKSAEKKDASVEVHTKKATLKGGLKATKNRAALKADKSDGRNEKPEEDEPEGTGERDSARLTLPPRDIILGVVNLLTLVILTFLLVRLPKEAQSLKTLRNESAQSNNSVSLQLRDIELNSQRVGELQRLFLNDSGVVDFVKEIEGLKAGGTITKLSFANQTAVKDQTGNFGIPVVIELTGSRGDIESDLGKIENLPFLFRPVGIEMQPAPEGDLLELKYGGFLYVQDELGQN